MAKRMVKHIEIIINSVKLVVQLKAALLIKSAEFMSTMAAEVSMHLTKVAQAHAQVAAADCVATLKIQQDILRKAAETCKVISHDVALTHKARLDMMKSVAYDLVKAAGDIATSMRIMAEAAAGNKMLNHSHNFCFCRPSTQGSSLYHMKRNIYNGSMALLIL
jgi:hypothetical protein